MQDTVLTKAMQAKEELQYTKLKAEEELQYKHWEAKEKLQHTKAVGKL